MFYELAAISTTKQTIIKNLLLYVNCAHMHCSQKNQARIPLTKIQNTTLWI